MPKIVDCRHLVDAEPSDGSTHYIFDDSTDVLEICDTNHYVSFLKDGVQHTLVNRLDIPKLINALEKIKADFEARGDQ